MPLMNKNIIIVLFLFFTFSLAAQKLNYLSINSGLSIPISKYSSTKNLNTDGYALIGLHVSLEGVINLYRNFGAGLHIDFGSNDINVKELESDISALPQYGSLRVSIEPYIIKNYMFGLIYRYNINSILKIIPKFFIGFQDITIPDYTLIEIVDEGFQFSYNWGASARKLAFLTGISTHLSIGNNLFVNLNLEYTGSKPNFKIYNSFQSYEYQQRFDLILINLGLSLGF